MNRSRRSQAAQAIIASTYLGRRVTFERIARGNWLATIDDQPEHYTSLARAKAEVKRVIEYAARNPSPAARPARSTS